MGFRGLKASCKKHGGKKNEGHLVSGAALC